MKEWPPEGCEADEWMNNDVKVAWGGATTSVFGLPLSFGLPTSNGAHKNENQSRMTGGTEETYGRRHLCSQIFARIK